MPYPMVATIVGKPQGSASTLLTSLAAYWKLDEASGTRADSLGVSSLTDNNTVTQNPGKVGNAAQFTAANLETLTCPDNAALSIGAGVSFEFAVWVYLDSTGSKGILSKWSGVVNEYIIDYVLATGFRVVVRNIANTASTALVASTFGAASINTWYLVNVWQDTTNNILGIRISDTAQDTVSYSGGVPDSTGVFTVGENLSGGTYWNGRIDELGLWKRVLTSAERTRLYNAGAGVTYPTF